MRISYTISRLLKRNARWMVLCALVAVHESSPPHGGFLLTPEENELLTRVGQGTPMGKMMRRYWMPACLSSEMPEPDCDPVRVRLLGEELIAFRDSQGRVGIM